MVDAARASKMADRIKVIVAKALERGVKDPRLGFVTITDVRVTGDLQHASVFYTVYGSDEERADTAVALKSATGMLRSEVGKNITARLTPSLEFIADGVPENAALIEGLLAEARSRDTEVEALAKTATYAGDEDPYVKPRVIAEELDQLDGDHDDDDDTDVASYPDAEPDAEPETDTLR
jgi:ribosome-binding factor A